MQHFGFLSKCYVISPYTPFVKDASLIKTDKQVHHEVLQKDQGQSSGEVQISHKRNKTWSYQELQYNPEVQPIQLEKVETGVQCAK